MSSFDGDFGIFEQQAQVALLATREVTKLRRENRLLQERIESMPGVAWELQQRIELLEQLLKAAHD